MAMASSSGTDSTPVEPSSSSVSLSQPRLAVQDLKTLVRLLWGWSNLLCKLLGVVNDATFSTVRADSHALCSACSLLVMYTLCTRSG